MLKNLNGNTRLFMTVGYPISQVKSPADITRAFNQRGVDAVQVPVEVPPDRIDGFFKGIELEGFQYCCRLINSNRFFNDRYFASIARYSGRYLGKSAAYDFGIHHP